MNQNRQSTKTILIVEDDPAIGSLLLQIITYETSYLGILVTNAHKALDMVRGVKPALLILDYWLPQMNGLELYDQLHDLPGLEDVRAVMVSASPPRRELEKRGIVMVSKPFDLDELLHTIETLIA